MAELFISVLNMSIAVFWAFIFVILIRLLLKRAPKIYSYIMWGIVFLRAVCPYFIPLNISIFNIFNSGYTDSASKLVYIPPQIVNLHEAIDFGTMPIQINDDIERFTSGFRNVFTYIALIWLGVFLVILLYNILNYFRFKNKLKASIKLEGNIYETDKINSAFVLGIFSPKIYIPANINEYERKYIIEHENVHIKRRDYIIKLICFVIATMHWFNPFIWAAFKLMNIDMEMSCDEKVIDSFDNDIKKDYTNSLLELALEKEKGRTSIIAFGENSIKSRIKNILKYKKGSIIIRIICIALIIVSAALLLTNPKGYAKSSVSIIGGADGPTSIFLAGKFGGNDEDEILDENAKAEEETTKEVITKDAKEKAAEEDLRLEDAYPEELIVYEESDYIILVRFKSGQDTRNITPLSEYELVRIDSNNKEEILDGCLIEATLENPIILAEDRLIYTAAKDNQEIGLSASEWVCTGVLELNSNEANGNTMLNFANLKDRQVIREIYTNLE